MNRMPLVVRLAWWAVFGALVLAPLVAVIFFEKQDMGGWDYPNGDEGFPWLVLWPVSLLWAIFRGVLTEQRAEDEETRDEETRDEAHARIWSEVITPRLRAQP